MEEYSYSKKKLVRKCRRIVSVIMLMVLLTTLLPSGAMAAEAPADGTNEIVAVEEPQSNPNQAAQNENNVEETDKSEETMTDKSVFGGTEDPNEGRNTKEAEVEEPDEGKTTEIAEVEEPDEGKTTETAEAVEPAKDTAEKNAEPESASLKASNDKNGPSDLSEYVDVTSLSLTRLDTDQEVTLLETKSENEDAYAVKLPDRERYIQMVVEWNLHLPDGQTLKEGDYVIIPLSCGNLNFLKTSAIPITDDQGVTIGNCDMTGSRIKVTFNENVNNRSSVTKASFDTGKQAVRNVSSMGIVVYAPITVGKLTRYLSVEARELPPSVKISDNKYVRNATNGVVMWWATVNSKAVEKLWKSAGAESGEVLNNYIYEDEFKGAKKILSFQILPFFRYPADPLDHSVGLTSENPYTNTVTGYFTKMTPTDGESYSAFRERIEANKLSYGYYTGEDSITVIINYGNLGAKEGPKYSDTQSGRLWFSNSYANHYIDSGWATQEERTAIDANIKESYDDSNVIEGYIPAFRSAIEVEYDPVYGVNATEIIENTDYREWDGGSDSQTETAELNGVTSTIELTSHSMAVYKYDSESNRAIEGASFKLQLWNGSSWTDYTAGDGGEMIRQTNERGVATFSALGNGKYRVVETKAAKGYALPVLEGYDAANNVAYFDEFTMSDTDDKYTANVANTKATVNVSAQKIWVDSSNKYSKRPENITLDIYKVVNGIETKIEGESKQISKNASGPDLTVYWGDMDLYDEDGNKLTYVVKEQEAPFYDTEITGSLKNGYKVTNTIRKDVVTLKNKTVTYDGSAKSLAAGISEKKGSLKYSTDKQTWTDKMPTFTNAGNYTVYAKTDDGADYIGADVTSAVLTIEKADLTITVKGKTDSKVYNGNEQSVTGYELTIPQGATLKESDIKGPLKSAKGTDVDGGSNVDKTYPMGLSADDFNSTNKNYNVTFKVTDGWLKITPTVVKVKAEDKGKTYSDADPEWTSIADGLVGTTKKIAELITLTYTREPGENVGEYKITVSGPEAFGNYTFTYEQGKLKIVQKAITITADSDKKVYDGKKLSKGTVTTVPALAEGDKIDSVTVTGSQTTVGKSDNVPSGAKIVNAAGEDVTANYKITYAKGELEVTARAITITADSDKKVYDGKKLSKGTVTTTSALAEGDKIDSVTVTGSQTTVGKSDNVPSGAKIVNAAGEDVTANYKITYAKGELEVTARAITITADSDKKVYDGKKLSKGTVTTEPALAEGDKIDSVTVTGSQTTVGKSDNVPSGAKIVNAAGEDVTANYKITYAKGELEVTRKEITVKIKGNTASKVCNKKEQSVSGYEVTFPEEVDYKEADIDFSGTDIAKGTDPGTYPMGLKEEDFANANDNYDVTFVVTDGSLEITPIPTAKITYVLAGGSYNGSTENIVETYEIGTVISIHNAPVRDGYTFRYWEGSAYHPSDKYTVKADHTFTAVWNANAEDDHHSNQSGKPNNGGSSNNGKSKDVKTGDNSNAGLYLGIMLLCGALLVGNAIYRKMREDR